jgi:hypothetical protein
MSLEEAVAKFAIKKCKEKADEADKNGSVRSLGDFQRFTDNIVSETTKVTEIIVKQKVEDKMREYSNAASGRGPMFAAILEIAKDDFQSPLRGNDEKLIPYLSRSQELMDRLSVEVETVKLYAMKQEKLQSIKDKDQSFKAAIINELEQSRNLGVPTSLKEIEEKSKTNFHLQDNYSIKMASEIAKELIEKGEYEVIQGGISPIINYEGKKVRAGRIYLSLKTLKDRGTPFTLRKEDVEAIHCDNFGTYISWLNSIGGSYNMEVQPIDERTIHCRRKDKVI